MEQKKPDFLMMMPLKEQKSILRKEKMRERGCIFPEYAYDAAAYITGVFASSERYKDCKNVLIYANYSSELRTDVLHLKLQEDNKNIFYPRVEGDDLYFCKVDDLTELQGGYKGIPEPYGIKADMNDPFASIIIVPGIVFGKNGYRIGYGRGFYDRYLVNHRELYKIGICYDVQLVDKCPHEKHDIKMNEIITEKQHVFIY